MANGSDAPDGGGRVDGMVGRLDSALKNRMTMLFTAVVLGTSGGVGIQTLTPNARSDPFTGQDAIALEKRVDKRIDALERVQALDNQHRIEAVEGYSRIRALEMAIARQTQATVDMKEEMKVLRTDLSGFLRRLVIQEDR